MTWGSPIAWEVCKDSVMTITVCQGNDITEDVAEIYLPWQDIYPCFGDGDEATIIMAIDCDAPWLGQHASYTQYQDAFHRAHRISGGTTMAPCILIKIKIVSQAAETSCHPPWRKELGLRHFRSNSPSGEPMLGDALVTSSSHMLKTPYRSPRTTSPGTQLWPISIRGA